MTKRVRMLGLALLVVTAVGAVSASAASAASFAMASSPSWLKGEQTGMHVWAFNGGVAKCTTSVYTSAEIAGTTVEAIQLHPAFSGCTAFGQTATFTTTGCDFRYTASSTTDGSVELVCSGGSAIVIKANTAGCQITISPQKPTTPTVDYSVSGSPLALSITSTVEGIHYTSSGGICGASGTNGKATGTTLVKAFGTSSFTGQHDFYIH